MEGNSILGMANLVPDSGSLQSNSAPVQNSTSEVIAEPASDVQPVANAQDSIDLPEWLPEKFKNSKDPYKALTDSYKELETKLGTMYGAPEEYKYDFEGDATGINLFKQVAKEHNLSQNGFESIVKSFVEKENAIVEILNKQVNEDKLAIGSERISQVNNMINSLGLEPAQVQSLNKFVNSKHHFEALEAVLRKGVSNVNAATVNAPAIDIDAEIDKIRNSVEYKRGINSAEHFASLKELYARKMRQRS